MKRLNSRKSREMFSILRKGGFKQLNIEWKVLLGIAVYYQHLFKRRIIMKRLMAKKFLMLVIVSIIATGLFFYVSDFVEASDGRFGGTLNVATTQGVDTLDPYSTSVTIVRHMYTHTHEMLFTYGEDYDVIPQLVDSYSINEDGTVWTLNLRQGVLFHNLKEMTAEDVLASWERYINVSFQGQTHAEKGVVMNKIDTYTITFEFPEDPGPFLSDLAQLHGLFVIFPKEIAETTHDRRLEITEMIGTGPYRFTEWRRGESVTMERFEGYVPDERFDGKSGFGGYRTAYLDRIVWSIVPEPGAQEAGLRSGRYDIADGVPAELKDTLEELPTIKGMLTQPLWINTMVNHYNPPLDDLRIRRAIQISFDNRMVMLSATGNADLIRLDPGIAFKEQVYNSQVGSEYYNVNDQEQAKKLLAEAGYDGEEIVYMTTTDNDYMIKSAIVIQQQLQQIGLNIRLEVMDWPALLSHITNHELRPNWHLSSMGHTTRFDPNGWYRNFISDAWTPHSNEEMDYWLNKVATVRDFDERYDAFTNVQRIFYEDVVNIKHGDFFRWHAIQSFVEGYDFSEGYRFWDVWFDK